MITLDIATNVADTLHDSLGQYKVLSHVATTLMGLNRLKAICMSIWENIHLLLYMRSINDID